MSKEQPEALAVERELRAGKFAPNIMQNECALRDRAADTIERQHARIEALTAQRDELLSLLIRYRSETPLGHQPHMIAHLADSAIAKHSATKEAE